MLETQRRKLANSFDVSVCEHERQLRIQWRGVKMAGVYPRVNVVAFDVEPLRAELGENFCETHRALHFDGERAGLLPRAMHSVC